MTAQPHALPERIGWKIWAAVALGGFVGTELRYVLGVLFPETPGAFPWTTLGINAAGSFALGWLTALWAGGTREPRWLQAGLGPGILGSFTTFSAVSLTIVAEPALLVPYLAVSLAVGLAAAAAGIAAGQRTAA